MDLSYESANASDLECLVALRIYAMKESLENIGRFDPERARARFVKVFAPDKTTKILYDNATVGFYMLLQKEDHLWLDHLYIKPEFQGCGAGSIVMGAIFNIVQKSGLPIKLRALKQSKSNGFYKKHGFIQTHSEEWDNCYIRE